MKSKFSFKSTLPQLDCEGIIAALNNNSAINTVILSWE